MKARGRCERGRTLVQLELTFDAVDARNGHPVLEEELPFQISVEHIRDEKCLKSNSNTLVQRLERQHPRRSHSAERADVIRPFSFSSFFIRIPEAVT